MVAYRLRLDDVLMSTKNAKVEATDTVTVRVPAVGSPKGKTIPVELDVSAEGQRVLDAMVEKARAGTRAAWAPVLALGESRSAATRPPTAAADADDAAA